jgi:hypothetical protein
MKDVPLIEPDDGGASGASEAASSTTSSETAADGPSVSITFSEGHTVVLDKDDLLVYLAVVQTLCFLYLVYAEMNR